MPLRDTWLVRLALAIVVVLAIAAVAAPWIAPYDPNAVDLTQRLQGPSLAHWLGTDHLGRDELSRLIYGTRISLGSVALCIVLIMTLAIAVGGASGYLGGRVDQAVMRFCDIFLAFPTIVLALFLIGILGTGMVNVVIAIALSHFAWYARMVRGLVLSFRQRDFVLASRAAGAGRVRIFMEHLLPAILAQMIVLATLDIGHMMLHVAGLSFLGLGVQPPTAEWGVMIGDARQFVWSNPMLIVWPGLALLLSVMAFNILGDAVRDRLDPSLHGDHQH
ncbi:nickel ABC transporter permease subunit NikC [Kaistia nematophila]|uniref:Nickel ABC transporter permease subunit NikC n=1 Tax=Kaistia nematophila TaxID=2994654 RepID=A0A9X3DZT3_9HYPH|nr:nickel ABC transporter permease subunit NikC [Kaistia nematophila]MCX5567892.1 nickel ABC transporter permease subunit NikC [Kaistia nematophila]